jgi:hypothetical protein
MLTYPNNSLFETRARLIVRAAPYRSLAGFGPPFDGRPVNLASVIVMRKDLWLGVSYEKKFSFNALAIGA